jgi:hypothetical protein
MSEYIGKTPKQFEPQGDRPKLKEAKEKVDLSGAIKARVAEFFEGADLTKDGDHKPDAIRKVAVETLHEAFGSDGLPSLQAVGDVHLFARGVNLRDATSKVNGVELARRITLLDSADPGSIYFAETDRQHFPDILDSGNVAAIHELYGVYHAPKEWYADPVIVAINVLDFTDGRSRVFFPQVVEFPNQVGHIIIPESEHLEMARQLGARV